MRSRTIKRFAPTALLAAALALPQAQPAFAAADPIILDLGQGCPTFSLRLDSTGETIRVERFKDKDGRPVRTITVRTGKILTYTNVGTNKSISFKTSGSVSRTVENPDGTITVTQTGHNGLILFPSDFGGPSGDVPSTIQYTGKIVFVIDPKVVSNPNDDVFTFVSSSGPSVDVCAALR